MSRNLRPLPVSTRLRTPRSPVEPRHKAWKHVSARPKRATSRRTVTYAEVSEDEEDEEEGDDQEDHEDEDEESDLSSSSGTSVSDSDQHSFFSSLSSHKGEFGDSIVIHGPRNTNFIDLTEDDSEDIIAVAPTPVAKMKSRFPPNIAQGRKQQSTLLFSTSKPMSGSQMRNKKKLSLLVKLNIHHTQSQSPTTGRRNPFNKLSIEVCVKINFIPLLSVLLGVLQIIRTSSHMVVDVTFYHVTDFYISFCSISPPSFLPTKTSSDIDIPVELL